MEKTLKQPKKLTKKRQGFARDYAIDPNGTKAVLNHYDIQGKDPEKIASTMAVELLGIPSVVEEVEKQQLTLKEALGKQGITPERIALKVDELLNHEDPNAVDKGLKHALNIHGVDEEGGNKRGNTSYTIIFNSDTQKKIKAIEAEIKEKLLNAG